MLKLSMLNVHPIPAFTDNYIWAIVYGNSCVVIDPGDSDPVFSFLKNMSIKSCFLGLGVGYSLKNFKLYSLNWIFPLFALQIIMLFFLNQSHETRHLKFYMRLKLLI